MTSPVQEFATLKVTLNNFLEVLRHDGHAVTSVTLVLLIAQILVCHVQLKRRSDDVLLHDAHSYTRAY